MNYKLIDLSAVTTKEELFDTIEDGLDLPVYFGKNLDALHDMLAHSDMVLEIHGFDEMKEKLGGYADALAGMLRDTEEESKSFKVIIR
ncbi:MAG: barstar family protein [Clostridia bacterium]|nr:barstar family protein [Clostridia bacterium]